MVTATPAAKSSSSLALAEVAQALDALSHDQGPQDYALAEKVSLTSLSGQKGSVTGRHIRIEQTATAYESKALAEPSCSKGRARR